MGKEATSSSSLYFYDTYSVGYDSMFIAYKEGSGTQQDPMAIYFYNGSKATGEYKTNSDSTCTLTIDPNSWRAKETIWECAVEARSCYADYVFNADTSGCAETELIFIADNGKTETMNFRMVMALGNLYSDTDDKIGMDGTGINSEGTQDFCYALRTDKNQGIYTETVRDTQGNVTASGSFTVKQTGTYETTTSGRITYSGGSYEEWTDVYTKNNPTTSKNEEKETLTVKYSDGYTLSLTFDSSRNVTGTVKNSSGATVAAISGKPDALSYGTELTVTYADGTKEVMVI